MHSHNHHHGHSHHHHSPQDSDSESGESKKFWTTERVKNLINLGISALILLAAPFFISLLTDQSLAGIRRDYQEANNQARVESELAEVLDVSKEPAETDNLTTVKIISKLDSSDEIVNFSNTVFDDDPILSVNEGDRVYLSKFESEGVTLYNYVDKYRLDKIIWLVAFFCAFVILLTGIKGISAFLGLIFATLVIFNYLLPEILVGSGVLWTTFVASVLIAGFSMFLSHGFNRFTSVAVISTLFTIVMVALVAIGVTEMMGFSGVTSHELSHLQGFTTLDSRNLDIQGLFLATIILGTLGVMDDVTISQAVIVEELRKSNPKHSNLKIFLVAMSIGREHIVSLINTLSIAYIATGLPFVIQFLVFGFEDPLTIINSEAISGEIVRIIVGSITLLSAIPLTTVIAVYWSNWWEKIKILLKSKTSQS